MITQNKYAEAAKRNAAELLWKLLEDVECGKTRVATATRTLDRTEITQGYTLENETLTINLVSRVVPKKQNILGDS